MKKILLVDEDEKTLSPFVKDLIETYQFEITWLKKADDVVETLKGTKFDIVILDVMMPIPEKWTPDEHRRAEHGFSTGTVLFQKIRQGFPDLPVLFYTAKGGIFTDEKSRYLRKPELNDSIVKSMKQLMNYED